MAIALGAFILIFLPFQVSESLFLADLKPEYPVGINLLTRLINLFIVIVLISRKIDFIGLVAVTAGCEILKNILLYIFARKIIGLKLYFDFAFIKKMLKKALPFGVATFCMIIYFKVDVLMLSVIKGDGAAGIYTAAYNFLEVLILLPVAFLISLFPVFSVLYKQSETELLTTFNNALKILVTLGIPVIVGMIAISNRIVIIFYGEQFKNSGEPLSILALAIGFIYIGYLFSFLTSSIDRQNIVMIISFAGMVMNIALNFVLIPVWSYSGAAAATSITELMVFMSFYIFIKRRFNDYFFSMEFLKPVSAAVVMGLLISVLNYLLSDSVVNLVIEILVGITVYFGCLYFMNWFNNKDSELVRNLFNK